MEIDYASFSDVVECLHNSHINYIVLRNYCNLHTPSIFQDGHGDIDLLCEDGKSAVDALHARPFRKKGTIYGDGVHYYITIGGQKASLDIRSVGDGYFCEQWERDMLGSKVEYKGFYVMNAQHHFYSLIYHAILQKRSFSQEYAIRLSGMAEAMGISMHGTEERDFMELLNAYMQRHGYYYCYCSDIYVPLRKALVDKSLLKETLSLAIRHHIFGTRLQIVEMLVRVKHIIERRR